MTIAPLFLGVVADEPPLEMGRAACRGRGAVLVSISGAGAA